VRTGWDEQEVIPIEESFDACRKDPEYEKAYNALDESSRWRR
jgi:hypothetical protein